MRIRNTEEILQMYRVFLLFDIIVLMLTLPIMFRILQAIDNNNAYTELKKGKYSRGGWWG